MQLYIVRHAWAGEYGDPRYPDDRLRPLTREGKERFAEMVRKLAKRGFAPRFIATSPLVRCRQTADIIAAGVRGKPVVEELPALAPGSDLAALLAWSAAQSADAELAWVGHMPDVAELTAAMIGDRRALIRFAKGAVAALDAPSPLRAGSAELQWLATAKLLGC
ncbi:MAG: histidine phosphatase family protein [Pirellulales bacterium]|nr:histidine phosphatase family protein [Pirellulales bacterium]